MQLSSEEYALAEKALSKFERKAHNWKRSIVFAMTMSILAILVGLHLIFDAVRMVNESREHQISKYIDDPMKLPEGKERDIWMVGTFRKCALILENRFGLYSIATSAETLGVMIFTSGLVFAALLAMRWNKGQERIVMAKLLRNLLEKT